MCGVKGGAAGPEATAEKSIFLHGPRQGSPEVIAVGGVTHVHVHVHVEVEV